ncbi:MAG: M28 family peptidase [bacterium]
MRSRTTFAALIIIFSFVNLFSQTDPDIQEIINEVSLTSLTAFVNELSGEVPTFIGGSQIRITSRNAFNVDNDSAASYIKEKLASFGLDVFDHIYDSNGRNVYAIQTGTLYPDQQFIICAHYDDMPSGSTAPGADDNASGTAAVLEAARILSSRENEYTIIYALWDEEEYGLIGSDYYADRANGNNDQILGVINLDMIAWDENNDMVCELHTKNVAASIAFANGIKDINTTYNIGLNINIKNPGSTASDHASFWSNGFSAILLIEDYYGGDFNNYYHTTNDLIDYFNNDYFVKMTRLGIASLASSAHVGGITPVELLTFNGYVANETVILKWSTATELNNYGFELQHSDDLLNWTNIGFIKGKINSIESTEYNFTDSQPMIGKNYYRLLQNDLDGSCEIFGPIEILYELPAKFVLLQNYPNPFNPSTKIGFNLPEASSINLIVYNILGQEIAQLYSGYLDDGYHEITFEPNVDNNYLSNGIYFYKLQAGNYTSTNKMIYNK